MTEAMRHRIVRQFGRVPAHEVPLKLARWLVRMVYSNTEMRVYRQELGGASMELAGEVGFRRDRWDDLNLYVPAARGDPECDQLLHHARVRRDAGAHLYTVVGRDLLEHFSWLMAADGAHPGVTFQEHFELPKGAAFLWDDYTHPMARGRGLHSASLRRRLADAASYGAIWAYICVRADNMPSRRNIERTGFRHCHSIRTVRVLNRTVVHGADVGG